MPENISSGVGLLVAGKEPDPAKRSNTQYMCTTTGPEPRLLGNKGAVMFAWYLTDVVAFVLGLSLWLWVLVKRSA